MSSSTSLAPAPEAAPSPSATAATSPDTTAKPDAKRGFHFSWRGVHRWIAFLITLQLLVVATTGVLLLFRGEIDRLANPALYRTTPGAVPLDTIRATIATAYPGRTVQGIALPNEERPILIANLAGQPRLQVIVDPGSGTILGDRDPGTAINGFILDLHRRLALGATGDVIIGVSGVLLASALLSGAWLWLRSTRRWKLGIRGGKGGGILTYDLHRLAGVIALPIGLLIAVTGVVLAYPSVLRAFNPPAQQGGGSGGMGGGPGAGAAIAGGEKSKPRDGAAGETKDGQAKDGEGRRREGGDGRRREGGDGKRESKPAPLSWDALAALGGPTTTNIQFPRKSGDNITLRLADGSMRWLDASGAEVRRQDGRTLQGWMLPLHSGEVGGPLATVLYTITALGILALTITGVLWWWFRRFAKAPARAAAPSSPA